MVAFRRNSGNNMATKSYEVEKISIIQILQRLRQILH